MLTAYAGHFTGGNGLKASRIEFGADAFDDSDGRGLLILGTLTSNKCSAVCLSHGLGCRATYSFTGVLSNCDNQDSGRYCWCGRA